MKPQLVEVREPLSVGSCSGAQLLSLSLQQELSAAIHAAFEVAVEIVVREVTELVSQATGNIYEQTRQESESLKQRLQRAEARLEAVPIEERIVGSPHVHPPGQLACSRRTDAYAGGKGDAAGHSRVVRPPSESRGAHMSSGSHREEEQLVQESERQHTDGCADIPEEVSQVRVVKVESLNQQCRDQPTQQSLLPPRSDEMFVTDHVIPKQESLDEERDDSSCYLDSVKVEDFSPDCMSAVQAAMLEEWNPQEQDFHQQDQDCQLACTQLANGISPNLELPCLSDFPNQLCEEAPIPKASPQVYGVHVRTSRGICHNPAPPYACKSCGQTFQLPSMLRRHHNHCQQRLQQPQTGSKRTKLQLYPPGCSPFRCTECNREFNRMENLKTHLRIHTGERPYTCSVCSKCFRHSGALTRHFRIHTGEKPYVCGQCGKSFRNCGGLKFHQRSHSK